MKAATIALALFSWPAGALAESIVIEELRGMMTAEQAEEPGTIKVFQLFEELDALSLEDRTKFRTAQPDQMFVMDRIVFMVTNESERARVCYDVDNAVRKIGPAMQRSMIIQQLSMALQASGAIKERHNQVPDTEITAEAIIMFKLADLQLQCLREVTAQ